MATNVPPSERVDHDNERNFFDFSAFDLESGREIPFSEYKGKVCLVVNVASLYKDKGFVVLGFPCNQFGLQENCTNEEICNTLRYVRPGNNFAPNFQTFTKVDVNGDNAHPVYKWLKSKSPYTPPTNSRWVSDQSPNVLATTECRPGDVQWNFEKFLVDRTGTQVKRYAPRTQVEELEPQIEEWLEQSADGDRAPAARPESGSLREQDSSNASTRSSANASGVSSSNKVPPMGRDSSSESQQPQDQHLRQH